jgi:hypothetical protein
VLADASARGRRLLAMVLVGFPALGLPTIFSNRNRARRKRAL